KMYHETYGIPYTILRVCVPYGNLLGDYSYGTMGFLLGRARKGQAISLYGDGSQKRTFSHVFDICDAMIKAAFHESTRNGTYNIGGDNMSLLQVAEKVAKKYGVDVAFAEWPPMDLAIESGDTIFDSGKLDTILKRKHHYRLFDWLESPEAQ
ncbi:MAG: NAD(P)-dependent oxidoreductase, partial [bacterium]|nr:NAD(P)-dependent oxidoreductase [bacterium]